MKNLYLKTAQLISMFALIVLILGCEQDSVSDNSPFVYGYSDDDNNPTGEYGDVTFWTNTYFYGTITVDLYDYNSNYITTRYITTYYSSSPDCGASGFANFYGLPEGNYYFYASATNSTNSYYWSNNFYLYEGCNTRLLY
jgi:hypothetical protein